MGFNHWKSLRFSQCLFFCESKLCNQYKNLYHYEWNLDGTVTRIGMNTNISAARSSRSLPNDSNPYQIVDDEGERLTFYKRRLKEERLSIQQFLNNDICNSSPLPVSNSYPKRKRLQTDFLMSNHPSNNNKKVAIKPLKNIEVGRKNYESMSIMTSEVNANHNSDNHPSNNKKRVVLKPRKSDNNKDNECFYKNCLYKHLKLENCATKR